MNRVHRILLAMGMLALLVSTGACRRLPVRLVAADQSAGPAERLASFREGGDGILVLAGRGLSNPLPPDSELALRAAAEAGFDGVWIEVQRSADGEPVVYGARQLEELTDGEGPVEGLALEDLETLALKGPEDLPPSRLLPLERALGLFAERLIVWAYVPSTGHKAAELAVRVGELIEQSNLSGTVVLETDSPVIAAGMKKVQPDLALAVRGHGSRKFEKLMADSFGASPWPVTLSLGASELGHAGGWRRQYRSLAVWGLSSEEDHYRAISVGANALLSDAPVAGLSLVRGGRRRP